MENKIKDVQLDELKKLCAPVVEYIRKNYDPHTAIIIRYDHTEVLRGEMGVPFEAPTCELFSEIIKREGIENISLSPEDNFDICVNGKKVDFEISGGPCQITVNWD